MKNILFLGLILLSPFVWAQKTECVRTKTLSREQILQMSEFKGTQMILAVSFDYKAVNTPSQLKDESGQYPVITTGYKEVKELSTDQEYSILDILVNYGIKLNRHETKLETEGSCYQPRNALLFYNKYGSVIGYFEICFSCHSHRFDPGKETLSWFCEGKTNMIKEWMKSVGITYGVNGEVD